MTAGAIAFGGGATRRRPVLDAALAVLVVTTLAGVSKRVSATINAAGAGVGASLDGYANVGPGPSPATTV